MKYILSILSTALLTTGSLYAQNGINVTDAKVYDNQSLTLKLEQLGQQLQAISVIDPTKLTSALGLQQGSQTQDVSLSIGVTKPAAGSTSTATAPTLPDLQQSPTYTPSFGLNAQDILADQINLTYRIFDLRMLLERSLTDRIYEQQPRINAVIGFKATIDPYQQHRDQAALIEITLTPSGVAASLNAQTSKTKASNAPASTNAQTPETKTSNVPASLVAQTPEAKTYNTSVLSTKSSAFSGAAVTRILNVGFSERRRGQTFYLFQDTDTVALGQLPAKAKGSLTFGWEFRPVLGRRSVSPIPRDLFAVISLDAADMAAVFAEYTVTVRTYWRRYNKTTLTTNGVDTNAEVDQNQPNLLKVYSSRGYERALTPAITCLNWYVLDDANVLAVISGKNFYPGTRVIIGSSVHDTPATGLVIKSDSTIELRLGLKEVATGQAVLSGRYGPSIDLSTPAAGCPPPTGAIMQLGENTVQAPLVASLGALPFGAIPPPTVQQISPALPSTATGISIQSLSYPLNAGDTTPLDITLQALNGARLLEPLDRPIITIGSTVIPPSAPFQQPVDCKLVLVERTGNTTCRLLTVYVPTSLLKQDTTIRVRIPFTGPTWESSSVLPAPARADSVNRLGGSPNVRLAISGNGFTSNWTVVIDKEYSTTTRTLDVSPTLLELTIPEATLQQFKQLLVKSGGGKPTVLAIPEATTKKDPKPCDVATICVVEGQTFSALRGTSPAITIKGTQLEKIKSAKYDDVSLTLQANKDKDATTLTVILTREVTRRAGEQTIRLEKTEKTDGTTFIPIAITVTEEDK